MDWSLNPLFGSYFLVILAALGLMIVLILVQEAGRLSRKQSVVLWGLRLGMCVVLLLFLLRPGVTFTKQNSPSGSIAILMDESTSMLLPSGDGKLSRWEQQVEILQKIWDRRSQLGKDNTWSTFLYSNTIRLLGGAKASEATDATKLVLPSEPSGTMTDIGGPLGQLMGTTLESPLSAVVWMGDGAQTQTPSGGDPLQFARRLAQLDIPLYVIGIGPRADNENSRDLSVEGVPEQLDVFTKNKLNVLGTLRCRGVANTDINVRLMLYREGQPDRELARTKLKPGRSDESLPFQLSIIAPDPGAYELVVVADPVDREAVVQNNQSTVYLNVRDGGARILYIEGEARFEMQFIRRSIGESSDLNVSILGIYKPPVQKWPVDLSQTLSGSAFDCIVLGDVNYKAIDAAGATAIADQVRRGAGLITLGGYNSYGPGGWGQSALSEVLPVQLGGNPGKAFDAKVNLQDHITEPIQVVPKGNSELLQIDTPESNAKTWASLEKLDGASRWSGIKNRPGVVLLAESQRGDPLIVAGTFGNGRVISLAFDSSYLWFRQGKSAEHKAFWRKLIYYCMRREAVDEGMQLRMTQRRVLLQRPAEVVLEWIAGSSAAEMPANISMHLWKMDVKNPDGSYGQDLGLVPVAKRDNGSMRANFAGAKEAGRFEWRAQTTASNGRSIEAKLPFVVVDQSVESLQPIPDWHLMEQMARLNASAGGTLIAPDQTNDILTLLQERRKQSTETTIENRKLGEGVLDSWVAFLSLGVLMLLQWSLRKKWNLP
ncbi:MAG: hypothetical protein ACK56W_17830 [Pirellula sp.]|jgi:uncharacterized membrane protein